MLGVSIIADDTQPTDQTPPPDQNSGSSDTTPNPSDNPDSSQNSSSDQSAPADTSSESQDTSLINSVNNAIGEQSTQTQPAENQSADQKQQATSVNQSNLNDISVSKSLIPLTDLPITQASQTVLTSSDIVSGQAEETDPKAEAMAQKQDEMLSKAQTPQEQATLSLDFAKDTVKSIEQHIKSDDFRTTTFEIQRLNANIDNLVQNSQKSNNIQLQNSAKTFCRQVDLLLKTQQLSVPEEAEQDFQIARAKCMEVSQ